MDLGLKGARVLVAASSRGLGAATARRFSLEGARVVINGREGSRLEATAAAISKESGGEVYAVPGNVADAEEVRQVVANAAARLGGLDILVTNAGGPPPGKFDTVTLDQWEAAFQLTLMSAVRMIHAGLPHLRKSERPAILTITSLSVKQPIDNLILSNSVRMGVIGLTKSLANELGAEGIRVNSILPGWTLTERVGEIMEHRAGAHASSLEKEIDAQALGVPLGRIGKPEEFANVAVFLCSPAASYVNGAMVPVDGGEIGASL